VFSREGQLRYCSDARLVEHRNADLHRGLLMKAEHPLQRRCALDARHARDLVATGDVQLGAAEARGDEQPVHAVHVDGLVVGGLQRDHRAEQRERDGEHEEREQRFGRMAAECRPDERKVLHALNIAVPGEGRQ
jgi:hypothetical protein